MTEELHPKLKEVLSKINFAKRYNVLCHKFGDQQDTLDNYDKKKVLEMIQGHGYSVKYYKSENFYKIKENYKDFTLSFNLILKYGVCDFNWNLLKNKERWPLGYAVWWSIAKLCSTEEVQSEFLPTFKNYEQLEEIFQESFSIYEDFKRELFSLEYGEG